MVQTNNYQRIALTFGPQEKLKSQYNRFDFTSRGEVLAYMLCCLPAKPAQLVRNLMVLQSIAQQGQITELAPLKFTRKVI